jgi:hypothetical protein
MQQIRIYSNSPNRSHCRAGACVPGFTSSQPDFPRSTVSLERATLSPDADLWSVEYWEECVGLLATDPVLMHTVYHRHPTITAIPAPSSKSPVF